MKKNILVIGMGYVGYSNAIFLADNKKNKVFVNDIDNKKLEIIESGKSPIKDNEIEKLLTKKSIELHALKSLDEIPKEMDFIILALPTDFNEKINSFDTEGIEKVVGKINNFFLNYDSGPIVVIRSTVNVGFNDELQKKYKNLKIIFAPEFLQEGNALNDNWNPSRIVIGGERKSTSEFNLLLRQSIKSLDTKTIFTNFIEAEAIKLFANAYLAMRISFFNELDSFSITHNLNTKNLIEGVCADKRIGNFYNNPSFGYGGYCLPKDTKQLLSNYKGIPQDMITSIVSSNETRKQFIASEVIKKAKKGVVGIYRLLMKKNADNFRESSILGIIELLQHKGCELLIFEPSYKDESFKGIRVEKDFDAFYKESSLILVNRYDEKVEALSKKVFSRDIFQRD